MAKRGKEKRGDPRVLRYVVNFLRFHSGVVRGKRMTQAEFGRACRMDQSEISRMELGKLAPSEDQLRRMVTVAQVEWSVVVHIREFYTLLIPAVGRAAQVSDRMPSLKSLEPVLLAIRPFLMDTCSSVPAQPSRDEELREATQIWTALERHPIPYRRRLIEVSPDSGSWALAVRVCEASLKSATKNANEALELAELAVAIAQRDPGEESWRSRLLGYCWAHVANARRVANDLAGADEAFAQAWNLWQKGGNSDPTVLDEWLLPAMEASLRRAQRRFSEALELVTRARACQGLSPDARLVLLLKEESILTEMGELPRALAALAEAAPLCEASGDRRMLLVLRFNMADDLCRLERYEEAAKLLPQVRDLAIQQANELDLIRLGWLTAKVAAGEGRTEDAVAGLEQVRGEFTAREMAYDAALSSLDLAVLWLKAGRTGEVKDLAIAMGWIFTAQGITREALASLALFCEAAMQESATVELARQVIADIEQARRSASSA